MASVGLMSLSPEARHRLTMAMEWRAWRRENPQVARWAWAKMKRYERMWRRI